MQNNDPLVTKLMSSIEVVKSFYKTLASDGLAALDLLEASTQWTEMFPGYAGTSIGPGLFVGICLSRSVETGTRLP